MISDFKRESYINPLSGCPADGVHLNQILDIKYNSTHILNREWQSLDYYPLLFSYIREKPMRVIHLRRENLLHQWISRMNAANIQTWWIPQGGKAQTPPLLNVNTQQLLNELQSMERENQLVINALTHSNVLTLNYASLFSQKGASVEQLHRIADWLGTDCLFNGVPQYQKQTTRSLHEMIENYDDVEKTLKNTHFEWMLRQDRPPNTQN